MGKLKIGFLINKNNIDQLTFEILEKIREKDIIFYEPIIILEKVNYVNFREKFIKIIKSKLSIAKLKLLINKCSYLILIGLVKLVESSVVKKKFRDVSKSYDLSLMNYKKIQVDGIFYKSKFNSGISNDDIKKLQKENFDILIRTNSGLLKGNIFKVPKLGILCLNLWDKSIKIRYPIGFWEALNKEQSIGFFIQHITQDLHSGDVIYRGNINAHKLWFMNKELITKKSSIFMIKVLEKIYTDRKLKKISRSSKYYSDSYSINNNPKIILEYINKILFPYIFKNLKGKIFGFPLSWWSVAYTNKPFGLKNLTKIKNFKEINNPAGHFFADPFTIERDNRKIIFVEDYFYQDNKGRISAIEVTNIDERFLGVVLEEDFHLSFPFIFKEKNKLFMVPECSSSNQIRLYECIEFPMKWEFKLTLMNYVSAVDTILIKKENIWFMLTNICSANIDNHSSELHIFYSDKLFSNKWTPIKQKNPVIFDSRDARNGGIIYDQNKIFRINQVQTPETYGYSLKINLINKLDKDSYEEETISEIKPFFKEDIIGTHHFSSCDDISVIDFHRKKYIRKLGIFDNY